MDQLDRFLSAIEPPAMSLEALDGFFAALICGPEVVLPSEYLPQIWGEDYSFASNAEATEIVGLIMRHWNRIADTLLGTLQAPHVYLPVLHIADDGITYGNDWAEGFMRGAGTRRLGWRELLDSDEYGGPMLPIMMLAHERDPDPEMRPNPIPAEKREELLQEMIAGLTKIYRYFEPHRRAGTRAPPRRAGPKIGRNDRCSCGSGRKYKFCCGATPSSLQ